MSLLNVWQLPMLWWLIVPTGMAVLGTVVLAVESKVPHHKRVMRWLKNGSYSFERLKRTNH
ncbi:MAG: hypothetical protein U0V74_11100 [Chitinophagales bacterium]